MKITYDTAQLRQEHLDAMIKLAFDLEDIEAADQLLSTDDPALTAEEARLAEEAYLLACARVDKQNKPHPLLTAARKVLPWAIHIAACIILLLAIAAPVALANSATFRAKVMQLLVELDNEKGEAHFRLIQDEEVSFHVPEGWEGHFFPTYIPEGYTIFEYPNEFFPTNIGYSNKDDNRIYFDEHTETSTKVAGTEGGTIEYVDINGSVGCMIYNSRVVDLTWEKDGKLLCLYTYGLSTDEALQVARSVKRIVK